MLDPGHRIKEVTDGPNSLNEVCAQMDGMKKLEELDLNALAVGVAELVKQQIGGEIRVYLDKFERGGHGMLNPHLNITFEVCDESAAIRNIRFFRDRLASNSPQSSTESQT